MSKRNRERRQMERNLANRPMWRAKFNKALDRYAKELRGYQNMVTEDQWGYPLIAIGRPALIHKGRKP